MNLLLSRQRYVCDLAFTVPNTPHETLAFEAKVDPYEELIAEGIGTIPVGSVRFHRLSLTPEMRVEVMYLELNDEPGMTNGTFHCDMPVDPDTFDRWLASNMHQFDISLNLNFGFMLQPGLKYDGGGPDSWRTKVWSTKSHPRLSVEGASILFSPRTAKLD